MQRCVAHPSKQNKLTCKTFQDAGYAQTILLALPTSHQHQSEPNQRLAKPVRTHLLHLLTGTLSVGRPFLLCMLRRLLNTCKSRHFRRTPSGAHGLLGLEWRATRNRRLLSLDCQFLLPEAPFNSENYLGNLDNGRPASCRWGSGGPGGRSQTCVPGGPTAGTQKRDGTRPRRPRRSPRRL